MRSFRLLVVLCGLAGVAAASTIVPHSLRERAQRSDRVAVVRVLRQWSKNEGTATHPRLKTYTRVAIATDVRGTGAREVTIVQLGGRDGPWELHVPGDATFITGETAMVFMRCPAAERCYLVALGEGRLPVSGKEVTYRDLFTGEVRHQSLATLISDLTVGVTQ
jgi:hypothetical protein